LLSVLAHPKLLLNIIQKSNNAYFTQIVAPSKKSGLANLEYMERPFFVKKSKKETEKRKKQITAGTQ